MKKATSMLAANKPIWKVNQLVDQGAAPSAKAAAYKILRQDLQLRYRRVTKAPIQANSERCLVLRQQYAVKMLPLLASGRRIINIDESWISETDYSRRMWFPSDAYCTIT